MANGVWQPLDFNEETAWLGGAASGGAVTGFDQDGWEASVWIAHAMFELPGMDVDYTHDDAHRARLAAGVEQPHIIGEVNLDDVSTVTGGQLGLVGRPSTEWVRVRWAELAVRLGASLDDQEFPPCFEWFPYRSWPAAMEPPPEGSLDELSLHALIPHLAAAGPSDECVAAYGLVAAGALEEATRCFRGPIGRVQELIDRNEWRIGTPSNIWPLDRSWFVYTDWDLWGTKVSGSQALIDQLITDPDLETLVWSRPDEANA
ncbi:MAG: hypothetical protein GY701_02830 [Sulfitobacter sp.]|nr:hypothetical protein [Sulfitobacter sp.]